MFRRLRKYLAFLGLVALSVSCTRLAREDTGGKLPVVLLDDSLSVSSEWGNLIGVSNHPTLEPWATLWFQDRQGTIRLVGYNTRTLVLGNEAQVIHRR